MIRSNAILAAVLVASTALAAPAFAAEQRRQPGPDWMTQEQALQKLSAAGYTNMTALKADKKHWEGRAVKDGRIVEVNVDPRTGIVAEETGEDDD